MTFSASDLVRPITLAGATALSVEMSTKRSAPCRSHACDDVARAQHVGLDRLVGRELHERHVLVGRGVQHHLRPVEGEDLVELLGIADVADAHHGDVGVDLAQFEPQFVETRLVDLDENEPGGSTGA